MITRDSLFKPAAQAVSRSFQCPDSRTPTLPSDGFHLPSTVNYTLMSPICATKHLILRRPNRFHLLSIFLPFTCPCLTNVILPTTVDASQNCLIRRKERKTMPRFYWGSDNVTIIGNQTAGMGHRN